MRLGIPAGQTLVGHNTKDCQYSRVQQSLVVLEIVSGVSALIALAWTVYTAYSDWKKAHQDLTNHTQIKANIAEADAKVIELKEKGEWLRVQGREPEALKTFAERLQQHKHARTLEASLKQPQQKTMARDVILARRVLNRGLLAAGLSVLSIVSGSFAGAAGAAQPTPTGESPAPSPSTGRSN